MKDVDAEGPTIGSGTHGTETAASRGLPPATASFHEGQLVGRYRIEHVLGRGGMGVVYRAHDPDLDRPIAIKVLRPEMRDAKKRLLEEGRAVAKLRHPNVITVFDVGLFGDDLFIAMELVDGGNLRQWLAQPRGWREVLARYEAAGRGLAAAHAAGLVHRDFKPDNVLHGSDGRIVVGDFGLAQSGSYPSDAVGAFDATLTAGLAGTPAYMAPEVFAGKLADPRSDQFAFCVAVWEALYGQRPFRPSDPTSLDSLRDAVTGGELREPAARAGVPARIHAAIRRGLARDPAERWASMDALLAALAANPPRRRAIIGGLVVALVAVLAASLVVAQQLAGSVRLVAARDRRCDDGPAGDIDLGARPWLPAFRAELVTARRSRCTSDAIRGMDLAQDPAMTCFDGAASDLATAASVDGWPQLRPLRTCLGAALASSQPAGWHGQLSEVFVVSPDQKRLVERHGAGAPVVIDIATSRELARLPVGNPVRWLDDGHIALDQDAAIVVCDATSGAITRTIPASPGVDDVTDDLSRAVAIDGGDLRVLDLSGGPSVLLGSDGSWTFAQFSPDGSRVVASRSDPVPALLVARADGTEPVTTPVPLWNPEQILVSSWLDDDHLVVAGAVARHAPGWLWRVHVDASNRLDRAPEPLLSAGDDGSFSIEQIVGNRILVTREVIGRQLELREGTRVSAAPSTVAASLPVWASADGAEVIAQTESGWISLDTATWSTTPIDVPAGPASALQGSPTGVIALVADGASGGVDLVDAGGRRSAPLPTDVAKATPSLRCRGEHCVVWGRASGDTVVYRYDAGSFTRLVSPQLGRVLDVDLSADGKRLAIAALGHPLLLLDGGTTETLELECFQPRRVRFARDDRALYVSCSSADFGEFALRKVDLATRAVTTVTSSSSTSISALEVLGEARLLVGGLSRAAAIEWIAVPGP